MHKYCPYTLSCRRGILEYLPYDIRYYYVENFVNHTCSPITQEEAKKLKLIFRAWDNESPATIIMHGATEIISSREILQHFIALCGENRVPGHLRNPAIESTELFTQLGQLFSNFKIADATVTALRNSFQDYFIYGINPYVFQRSTKIDVDDVIENFKNLFSFHPYLSYEKNLRICLNQFVKNANNCFQDSKTLVSDIAIIMLLILMHNPGAFFVVRYDPLGLASRLYDKNLQKSKSIGLTRTENESMQFNTSATTQNRTQDQGKSQKRKLNPFEEQRFRELSKKSLILTQNGTSYVDTESVPFHCEDSNFQGKDIINVDGLFENEDNHDFSKSLTPENNTSVFSKSRQRGLFRKLVDIVNEEYSIRFETANSASKRSAVTIDCPDPPIKLREEKTLSMISEKFYKIAPTIEAPTNVERLIKRGTLLKNKDEKSYISFERIDSTLFFPKRAPSANKTASQTNTSSNSSDSQQGNAEVQADSDVLPTDYTRTDYENDEKITKVKSFTSPLSERITPEFSERVLHSTEALVIQDLPLVLGTKLESTICERYKCSQLEKDIEGNLKKKSKENSDHDCNPDENTTPRCCSNLSHTAAEMALSVLRVFPVNPLKLNDHFHNWFPTATIKDIDLMMEQNLPFCPTQLFYVPEVSRLCIKLVNPMISVESTFLENKAYKSYFMYVASGLTPNYSVINLAIGFYQSENEANYTSFLTNLREAHKQYFEDYNPAIVSNGGNGIHNGVKNALPRSQHYLCSKYLAQNASKVEFNNKDNSIKFVDLLFKILSAIDLLEIDGLRKQIVEILKDVKEKPPKKKTKRNTKSKKKGTSTTPSDIGTVEAAIEEAENQQQAKTYVEDVLKYCYACSTYPRFNQMAINCVEINKKATSTVRLQTPFTIAQEFDRITHRQIEEEKENFYYNRHKGVFVNDDVSLIPGIVSNLSYSLMHIQDYSCTRLKTPNCERYCVSHNSDSVLKYFLDYNTNGEFFNPSDFTGIYEAVNRPFGTKKATARTRRVNNAFSREKYKVDLDNRTCTCTYFQHLQYPCLHALVVIMEKGYKVSDYCSERYRMSYVNEIFEAYKELIAAPKFSSSEMLQLRDQFETVHFGTHAGLCSGFDNEKSSSNETSQQCNVFEMESSEEEEKKGSKSKRRRKKARVSKKRKQVVKCMCPGWYIGEPNLYVSESDWYVSDPSEEESDD